MELSKRELTRLELAVDAGNVDAARVVCAYLRTKIHWTPTSEVDPETDMWFVGLKEPPVSCLDIDMGLVTKAIHNKVTGMDDFDVLCPVCRKSYGTTRHMPKGEMPPLYFFTNPGMVCKSCVDTEAYHVFFNRPDVVADRNWRAQKAHYYTAKMMRELVCWGRARYSVQGPTPMNEALQRVFGTVCCAQHGRWEFAQMNPLWQERLADEWAEQERNGWLLPDLEVENRDEDARSILEKSSVGFPRPLSAKQLVEAL